MDSTYPIAAVSAVLLAVSLYVLYARPSKAAAKVVTVAEVVDERPVVRLLYGTQTGTAEKFSKQLAAKLTESYGEATRFLAMDVEHYKHEELLSSEVLMFFLLATYGDGEPTDNAMAMYDWITKTSEDVMNGDQPEIMKVRSCNTVLHAGCLLLDRRPSPACRAAEPSAPSANLSDSSATL